LKTKIIPTLLCIAMFAGCGPHKTTETGIPLPHNTGTIKITGAFALYPLTKLWISGFRKIHPETQFELTAVGTGLGFDEVLSGNADIAMISNEIPYEADKMLWNTPVARLAVVPVINSGNPYLTAILKKGIRHDELAGIFSGNGPATWGEFFGNSKKDPIHIYIRADKAGASEIWMNYLFLDSSEVKGIRVNGEDNLIREVKKDPLAISYCNFVYAYDPYKKQILDGISVLPLDINRNGKIDEKENFYHDFTELQRAMWSGKFPHVLIRDLYFVTKGRPGTFEIVEFLKWVLTEGQKMIPDAGYIELHTSEIRCRMNFLTHIDTMNPGK
jgi:phosphate transport system substrate-binding protein